MPKVGRNQPCPCQSGKKYKLCCLPAHEAARLQAREEQRSTVAPGPGIAGGSYDDDDCLDDLSNGALDLIHAGRFDDADRACQQLLAHFPDVFDGHMRLGQLWRARGDAQKAAQHLRLAAAMARASGCDPELSHSLAAEADELDPPGA